MSPSFALLPDWSSTIRVVLLVMLPRLRLAGAAGQLAAFVCSRDGRRLIAAIAAPVLAGAERLAEPTLATTAAVPAPRMVRVRGRPRPWVSRVSVGRH